jgi:DNA-binding GntR family transcriptional regulator
MAAIYQDLNVYVQVAWAHYLRELRNVAEGQREHSTIVAACAAGDVDLLRWTLRQHISTARDLILENISGEDKLL